jgi:hypothetical protein
MGGGTDAVGDLSLIDLLYTDKGDISEFTDSELLCIRNFVSLLSDSGVMAEYTMMVAEEWLKESELVTAVISEAGRDVARTCGLENGIATKPEAAHEAAPSLKILVEMKPRKMVLPDDFIVSDTLLKKCMNKFYEDVRRRIAKATEAAANS